MKLIHHVKKHGKTITMHLKKHHKKYIFGILSATLLWKGVSLIAAYALVHNLSFSFADIVHNGGEYTETIENETTDTGIIQNETINEEKDNDSIEEEGIQEQENQEETLPKPTEDGISDEENVNNEPNSNNELNQENEGNTDNEQGEIEDTGEQNNEESIDDNLNMDTDTDTETTINNENLIEEKNNLDGDKKGNGVCDSGDIEIISPLEGDITGKTFDISRKFTNDDCKNNSYTIRLRDSTEQYLDIFSGDYNTTGFSFDSTQLTGNYFSGYKIAVVSDEAEILYRNAEGGEFTIDNKAPTLSKITTTFSTKNKKLNIGDTITISFEGDEKLTDVNINILGQTALFEEKTGTKLIYTMDFSNKNTEGKVVYGIEYSDNLGNTGYYEGYENIELDYTKPQAENFEVDYIGNDEIKITFSTSEYTNSHFVYQLSGLEKTDSIDSTGKNHEFTIKNIKNKNNYNYSISIEDEAKNALYIAGTFTLSGNKIDFTNQITTKANTITEIGFNKTGDIKNNTIDLKQLLNSFDTCSNNIKTSNVDLTIKGKTANIKIPEYGNQNIYKLTNTFIVVLFEKIEKKTLSQKAINEITEDLNNFLLIIKLVKDDENECKQNMTQYYVNRFKNTLTKYKLINN